MIDSPPSRGPSGPLPEILIVTAGGLEHGGGIGRVIGYMLDGWRGTGDEPRWRILDSRGPRVSVAAMFRFAGCLLSLLVAAPTRPLVHIHIAGRGSTVRKVIAARWAALLGLPVILHLHDYNYRAFCAGLPRWAHAIVAGTFRRAARVVVLGRGDAELVATTFGVPPAKVAVMHNAVAAPAPPVLAKPEAPVVSILFLGRLSERKGVPDLIRALADPALRDLPWRATLAGDGDLPHFQALAREQGVADRIDFPGWLDRSGTDRLLRAAEILVLPSYDEGMAMSVLEGLAYRVCVVCTPVGALAEVIEPEVSGLLVRPGDVAGLAAALRRAIESPAERRRLAEGGEALFRKGFEAAGYARRMTDIYRAVAATR